MTFTYRDAQRSWREDTRRTAAWRAAADAGAKR